MPRVSLLFLSETAEQILAVLATGSRSRAALTGALGIKSSRAGHFLRAMEQIRRLGLAELTIPDKPQSKNQQLRITDAGRARLARKRSETR